MDDKPTSTLEEQLTRQKGILSNTNLVKKLPDKGAKLRDSVTKIEAELLKRRNEAESCQRQAVVDVGELEWSLRSSSISSAAEKEPTSKMDVNMDSDDDEETNSESQNPLEIIATSQITQRQPKPTIPSSDNNPEKEVEMDLYVVKLLENDVKTIAAHLKNPKFLPAKSLKRRSESEGRSSSPASASASPTGSVSSSNINTKPPKWDECLMPPTHAHQTVALLSMEETVKISCHQYKKAQDLERLEEAKTKGKKKYAYDRLMEQGVLSNYTVEMQTSRPVRTDADDDEFEEDLNDDEISEESESNESDGDHDDETSKDLSNLVNASLKLTS